MKLESVLPPGPALLISLLLMSSPALAQQAINTPARVVWVSVFSLSQVASYLEAFRKGLAEEGYVEGRDIEILARSAEGSPERQSAVVDEIVSLKPSVIVSQGAAIFGVRKV